LVKAIGGPVEPLIKAGLAHRGRYEVQDSFRGRVMFPIFDPAGDAIALGGRILPGAAPGNGQPQPKYRNSPETPIYSKRRTLYGLNWARQGIVQEGEIVVCEGYTDVIGLFTSGVTRAVATCGTALTDEHFRLIARFAKKVVLAFDADSAGQSAAARFYAWEAEDDVTVSVAALPAGSDPGDLAREDPAALRKAIAEARPFLGWRVERALNSGDLSSPEGRAKAADAAIAMIAEHPDNALVRDQYLVTIADRTRIGVVTLRERLERGTFRVPTTGPAGGQGGRQVGRQGARGSRRAYPPQGGQGSTGGSSRSGDARRDRAAANERLGDDGAPPWDPGDEAGYGDYDAGDWQGRTSHAAGSPDGGFTSAGGGRGTKPGERHRGPFAGERAGLDALLLAVHQPSVMAPRLDEILFADPLQRATFHALANAASLHEAIETADEPVADLLRRLAVSEPAVSADQTVVALVRTAASQALRDLEADARVAEANGKQDEWAQAATTLQWATPLLQTLQDPGMHDTTPPAVTEAANSLLGWLVSRHREGA
jgi:DNA primase